MTLIKNVVNFSPMKEITQHFGKAIIYQFGPIYKAQLHTPFKQFSVQCPVQSPFKYPIQNSSLFYVGPIFNSYVKTVEETFSTLFSADGKLTIIKEKIQPDVLLTFKIVSENSSLRVAEVYKFEDPDFVGFVSKGRVRCIKKKYKFSVNGVSHDFLPLREYYDGEEVTALLIEHDGTKKVFRPIKIDTAFFNAKIYKYDDKFFFCKNDFIYGILAKKELNREAKVDDILKVRIQKENNYKFVFTTHEGGLEISQQPSMSNTGEETLYAINKEIKSFTHQNNMENPEPFAFTEGSIHEALIRNVHAVHGTFVSVDGFIGIMKKGETSKGFVIDIQMHLCGRSTIKGVMYNIDRDNRSFMFSIRKYEDIMGIEEENNNGPLPDEEISTCGDENTVENIWPGTNKRVKTGGNDSSFIPKFEDIYNAKGFKDWSSNEFIIQNIQEFRSFLESNIETDTSLVKIYIQVLLHLDIDVYTMVKKHFKNESLFSILFKKCLSSLSIEATQNILKLHFSRFKTPDSFKRYFSFLLSNKSEDPSLLKNIEYPKEAVEAIYRVVPNEARARVEQFIGSDKIVWECYLEQEKADTQYCRNLFRRVTAMKWKAGDAKTWFKKWLEFEKDKEEEGYCEEVKEKARLFVKGLKDE